MNNLRKMNKKKVRPYIFHYQINISRYRIFYADIIYKKYTDVQIESID
jgi:hypothetical protein